MKMPSNPLRRGSEPAPQTARHGARTKTAPAKGGRKAAVDDWKLNAVVNHVTFSADDGFGGDRMIAWYVADPVQWSFRSVGEGESLIEAGAQQLADLVGSTVYIRVTTRPYPVSHWAKACYENAPEPQAGFVDMMDRDQRHAASAQQVDKLVYYGVDLGGRGAAMAALGKVYAGAVDREMKALQTRLDAIDHVMRGVGLHASPASAEDMEWLLARSFALGCPVPVPSPDELTSDVLTSDDLAAFAETARWDAEPLDSTVRITTTIGARQVTRYVCVLTLGRTADIRVPEEHEPWMSKADKLPFTVEQFGRVDVRAPEEVSREMGKLTNRIDAQVDHWVVDHNKRPPKQLGRQADKAADVEDEMRSGFDGLLTRTRSWFRFAVSGETEDEALTRAQALIDHYKPQIQLTRDLGQYALAREFVPGEPLATTAHARRWPVMKVAAGLPAISAEVGDRRGFQIGETAGLTRRMVAFDPWYLPEVMDSSGLIPMTGTLGSGKSVLGGYITYKSVQSGVVSVALDPSGRLQEMTRLPELAGISRSVNLLGGEPGSLDPYGTVPEPNPDLVRLDCDDPTDEDEFNDKMKLARDAARANRRDLCFETLRWCLPYEMVTSADGPAILQMLRRTIAKSDDRVNASAANIISNLRNMDGTENALELANLLEAARERELGRLFFHGRGRLRGPVDLGPDARLTMFNLRGLIQPPTDTPIEEYSAEELLARPIMRLASWAALNLMYRHDPNQRKLFLLDEAHEITEGSGAGRALVTKISTDSRKNNTAALILTQNASSVLGTKNIRNFVGAAFVGRAGDEEAQKDALTLLGKPHDVGYEETLGNLSYRGRRDEALPYREFIYRDGLGGDGGRGGMEKIRVSLEHHPELFRALKTTPDGRKPRPTAVPDREEVA